MASNQEFSLMGNETRRANYMKRFTLMFSVILLLAATASSQENREKYVGRSSCDAELQPHGADFGMRLDKTQRTYLEYRNLGKTKALLIIQYQAEGEKCGVIRDVVETRDLSRDFEFSCTDLRKPSDVVVGSSKRKDKRETVPAIEAWRIDLKALTFNLISRKVSCTNESYTGQDDGSDLVDAAKKRAPGTQ
jgi:hypothetical protein